MSKESASAWSPGHSDGFSFGGGGLVPEVLNPFRPVCDFMIPDDMFVALQTFSVLCVGPSSLYRPALEALVLLCMLML